MASAAYPEWLVCPHLPMKILRLPRLRPTILLASFGLAFTTLAGAAPASYTVNLTTPWKIGQTYTAAVSASETTRTVLMMGEKTLQDQTRRRSAKLDADSIVLAVHAHGGLSKAEFTIRTLLASSNGAPEAPMVPAGAKIVAENTGEKEKSYTINGAAATPDQKAILDLVISLDDPKTNDQTVFGPKKAVAVGETWQLDGNALKENLGKGLGQIGTAQGAMHLDTIEGSGASQIAVVSGTMTFSDIKPGFPPGITPKSCTFKAVLDGRIPATRASSQRVENLTANADLNGEATGPNGTATFGMKMELKSASVLTFR